MGRIAKVTSKSKQPSKNGQLHYRTARKRLSSLKPSPENCRLYNSVNEDDREIAKLAASIQKHGLREPLIITADNWIVSGHRRYAALNRINQVLVPCRVLPQRRDSMTDDQFIELIRDCNRQRNKSVAEQVREELVDIDPADAHRSLIELRDKSVNSFYYQGVQTLNIEGVKRRWGISDEKSEHVEQIRQIVFKDRRAYWPLSVRSVHYALLNYGFLRNIRLKLKYKNDDNSYQATSDLVTRLRLSGDLPWEAFDDPTRPFKEFRPFSNVRDFVREECSNLFLGYWRDLLQTQPNHVEVLCEKNTVYHMVLKVTEDFQIPTSSGRGFNSIDPWHDLVVRYQVSRHYGKKRLIVIVLSDYDPEGEMIPQVGGRTLRDDFGLEDFDIIKAGVTREQIERHDLPSMNFAKETSTNHDWYVERNDGDGTTWELEALEPEVMMSDLRDTITSVLDMELFNREAATEQSEAAYLEAARRTAREALKGLAE